MQPDPPARSGVVVSFDAARRTGGHRAPPSADTASFPIAAGILFGLSLGGFFDSVVLHQIVHWHETLAAGAVDASAKLANLHADVLWDDVVQLASYLLVVAGACIVWRAAQRGRACWSRRLLAATMLVGFGAFNLLEGAVAHLLLGLHHANETVPRDQWLGWDLGFVVSGAVMLVGGLTLYRSTRTGDAPHDAAAIDSAARPAQWRRR